MKKICIMVCLCLVAVLVFLPSCGNMSMGIGEYNFSHIRITDHSEGHCFDVEKWYDCEGCGIEVKVKGGGAFFISEGSYILINNKDDCPFCRGG